MALIQIWFARAANWSWAKEVLALKMADEPELQNDERKFATVLGNVLSVSANEMWIMTQMEAYEYFSPMPASFPLPDDDLERRLDSLSELTGGAPRLIVVHKDEDPPEYDTYLEAAVNEAVSVFMRARSAVCRTHIFMIGEYILHKHPQTMNLPEDADIRRIYLSKLEDNFWEHAESSFIRLASYWDRVGQILDFVFFNIRQYERDGFAAVADRIQRNFLPIDRALSGSSCWSRLRQFQNSEKPDGLKWLLRRRNLLVHSLHLSKRRSEDTHDPIFDSAFNHLSEAVASKLRQGTPKEEVSILHAQLERAAVLFPDVIEVAIIGAERNKHP